MPYIKKLVMKGFKSFATETEIPFINGMNVIVGPNGSGKSNISDAICFVLGRLSIKSMRAAKSANLIFSGTKKHKPSNFSSVKLFFDNSDKGFFIDKKEIIIERAVKRSGQSTYRINDETKTRQEVLELLAQAGIDPHGFNLILQGEINDLIKATSEERRKIIEQVAGISVYEIRKQKSLNELEKTDSKLKEIAAILRERTAYLKNLEKEREQALKFKQLEKLVKKCKASIINKKIIDKKKEIEKINKELEIRDKEKEKIKSLIKNIQAQINDLEQEINEINSKIQKSTGIEQETLYSELTSLRESLAGLDVHKENAERRLQEILSRRERAEKDVKEFEKQIQELRKKSPLQAKKQEELRKKKQDFEELEKEKRKFYSIKSELNSKKQRILDQKTQFQRIKDEADFILNEIEKIGANLKYKTINQAQENLKNQKNELAEKETKTNNDETRKIGLEKAISVYQTEINNLEKIKKEVSKLDICPLCKSKITPEHIKQVYSECDEKIISFTEDLNKSRKNLDSSVKEIKE